MPLIYLSVCVGNDKKISMDFFVAELRSQGRFPLSHI